MRTYMVLSVVGAWFFDVYCRDEEKISKGCYWPNEVFEPCFGGCAEISCDNPRNHLRPCYPYCEPGCVCEEPYVRDDRTHQCVLPQDCSPTQMGIPVPTRRSSNTSPMKFNRLQRRHGKDDIGPIENDVPTHVDERKAAEISRMGNYFNIVIAPPPIRALQPRKLVQGLTKQM
ncbi:unnamed protein product [Leptosia nina]|uniref:TIL domain-containing protein n=1 Tax=Leptosia nina TaxID=320188 RepID=A0AAV1K4N4_9NEOP